MANIGLYMKNLFIIAVLNRYDLHPVAQFEASVQCDLLSGREAVGHGPHAAVCTAERHLPELGRTVRAYDPYRIHVLRLAYAALRHHDTWRPPANVCAYACELPGLERIVGIGEGDNNYNCAH